MFCPVHLFLLICLLTYCALKWMKNYKIPLNFPPGPPAVPFVGVLPFIKGDFKAAIQSWREVYGEVVGVQLGSELAVFLSDFDVMSNAFKDNRFTGRPKSLQTVMSAFFSTGSHEQNGGIVFTHGAQWTEQRRFALKTLRDFGFGKKSMEDVIAAEVNKLSNVLALQQEENCSTSLVQSLSVAVVNSIWTILTGERIPHGDATVREIVEGTEEFIKNESLSGPIMMLPWLRHVPGIREKFQASKRAPLKMRQLQDATVAQHEEKANNNGEDFIDVYLQKIRETTDITSSFYGDGGKLNLQRSLTDLFGAGTETSSSVLLFAFLYMIRYPEVQEKIQQEIAAAVGADEAVTLERRQDLPYTDAALHEVLRHTCLVYTVPHATTCDVELEGYHVPEATAVYANVWNVMHNREYWTDPEVFRPERFLDATTGKFRRDDRCIPFMLGKRFCIGQSLAQIQLFLFFAGILQRFKLEAPQGSHNVSTEPIVGFLHSCPSYDVLIRKRQG